MGINAFFRLRRSLPLRRLRRRATPACLVAIVLFGLAASGAPAVAQTVGEYTLRAGYLYNFLLLTDWPARPAEPADSPLPVCIIGDDPFGAAIDPIGGRDVSGRRVVIRRIAADAAADELGACRLLFLAPSVEAREQEILARLAAQPVLTVSDAAGFVDRGGMIGFVVRGQRLRFEINRAAGAAARIDFRSKLLRLADRVVGG